jgi:catechol 2,3-dioxygenase-like lactoylglutathione lyase family enzyme
MKRFHVHVHVDDLAASIGFYSKLFAAEPTRHEADYAKWMLDDPQGVAWEHFHTLADIPVFSEAAKPDAAPASACCTPAAAQRGKAIGIPVKAASACC